MLLQTIFGVCTGACRASASRMTRSSCSIVAPLVMVFLAACTESGGSGPSTERTGGTGGSRAGSGGSSVAGRGGTGGSGGSGAAPGGGSAGSGGGKAEGGMSDGGMSDGALGADGVRGADATGGTGGTGGSGGSGGTGGLSDGGMSDGRRNDASGGADGGGVRDSGKADGMMMRDSAGPPDKPPMMVDARPTRDAVGPQPMRDAAPYRDAAGPGTPNPPGGGDFCPQAIRHSAAHPPGGVGVGQGIECDNINVGRIACDQAGRQRFECFYNATPSNPNNFGKHWEACDKGGRRCQTCRLTIVTERPPPYFNPFAAATCN
jgi:hypothetical protein